MSMTKVELMNVFRDAASAEFSACSPYESDYSYEFSERFERRMDRLVKSESRPAWRFVNTNPKRLIILIVAVIMALTAAACAVPEIRESIAGFFIQMFSDYSEITAPEPKRRIIEDEYDFYPTPDGFSVTKHIESEILRYTEYMDENDDVLTISQTVDSAYPAFLDNERGDYTEYEVNGKVVLIYQTDGFSQAIWMDNGYIINVSYYASADLTVFTSWIGSVVQK